MLWIDKVCLPQFDFRVQRVNTMETQMPSIETLLKHEPLPSLPILPQFPLVKKEKMPPMETLLQHNPSSFPSLPILPQFPLGPKTGRVEKKKTTLNGKRVNVFFCLNFSSHFSFLCVCVSLEFIFFTCRIGGKRRSWRGKNNRKTLCKCTAGWIFPALASDQLLWFPARPIS